MKLLILEATAKELNANRRVADALVDAVTNMCDRIARVPWNLSEDSEEVESDEDSCDD